MTTTDAKPLTPEEEATVRAQWAEAPHGIKARLLATLDAARAEKDSAYAERNQCVAFISKLATVLRWRAWLGRHDEADTTWDREWLSIVFVETPMGQLSWHIHDRELPLFEHLPPKPGRAWDGHTTAEKYERMARLDPLAEREVASAHALRAEARTAEARGMRRAASLVFNQSCTCVDRIQREADRLEAEAAKEPQRG